METDWNNFRETLISEIGGSLAGEFVDSLHHRCHGTLELAERFFYELGASWAPLLRAWAKWITARATGTIVLALRDAKPLEALPVATEWRKLYLNRLTCGIQDEIAANSSVSKHPLLKRYLKQSGCEGHFTLVDSGCYGTVVLELHKVGVTFQPLFFFSKNPHIPGFLNEIGISLAEGEILNDSLECGFPHSYKRPSVLIERSGVIQPLLEKSDELSIRFCLAAVQGLREAPAKEVEPREAAVSLLELSQRARFGKFTGVLRSTSPEWSKKAEFLATWPQDLHWR